MAPTVSEGGSERTAMERFGSGGMALLPWTKQMLTVLWEHLRLLVQVIYYTFVSVFQMFRFEVHVRITDESGEHIQHMGAAESESFLFSSLFDGENGVMVGGSNPLSTFCADVGDPFTGKSTAEALLSSLRGDDLCCGLVEDFVSRTAGKEDSILLGHQSTWKMGFPGDWNIFVSSSDSSNPNDTCHKGTKKRSKPDLSKEKVFKPETSEEERSSHWSSEEDQNLVEFESEESKALWESLSKSSDPYNPFCFSACISTKSDMGKSKSEVRDSDLLSVTKAGEVMLGPPRLNMWVCRSDSESSWSSWASSEGSSPDIDKEENERLWDFFSSPEDPYNPLCFTATSANVSKQAASLPAPPPKSETDSEEKESSFAPSDDDEEELLWNSLSQKNDPYHPLNFQACLQSSLATAQHENTTVFNVHPTETKEKPKAFRKSRSAPPALTERNLKKHSHPDKTLVPWKRPEQTPPEEKRSKASSTQKKVQFSPLVQVHVMRTWPFARQASRKGHWEELARDRDRFRRRVLDTERAVGHCFTQPHRERMRAFLDGALKQTKGPEL
uniref:Protein phosphatase 1, regulatory subunit 15B n=1 Tax=Iconisemion striatum TaxID=60296 RepID=A0A1A7YZB7_9TELE